MAGFLLYLAVLLLPAPVLALLAVRLKVLPTVRKTYFFWAAVSLLNFGFLAFLPFPPLLLIQSRVPGSFVAFLLPPACAATLIVLSLSLAARVMLRGKVVTGFPVGAIPYLVNLAFFVAFVGSSEAYKAHLIRKALDGRSPECVRVSSFVSSLMNAGADLQLHAHAILVERGRKYYWSYSNMSFFEGNDRLDPNFPCSR